MSDAAKYNDAVQSIRRIALVVKGLVDLSEVLEQIGAVETAVAESKTRLADARADEAKLLGQLADATAKRDAAQAAADRLVADAQKRAGEIADAAKAAADETITRARISASLAVEAARADADALQKSREDAMEHLREEIESATADAASLATEIAHLTEQRDAIAAEVAALRAKFQ